MCELYVALRFALKTWKYITRDRVFWYGFRKDMLVLSLAFIWLKTRWNVKKEEKKTERQKWKECECTSVCLNTLLIYILLTTKFFSMFFFVSQLFSIYRDTHFLMPIIAGSYLFDCLLISETHFSLVRDTFHNTFVPF